jgi:fructose-1,6-bisphosphatase/inositol monophosphatase family enzyme
MTIGRKTTDLLFTNLFNAIKEASTLAMSSQSTVVDIGENVESMATDNSTGAKLRAAKTEIDIKVQEILLKAVLEIPDIGNSIRLDAEEDSPSTSFFHEPADGPTLVVDPIDGTYGYIRQGSEFSICCGLIENHQVSWAIVSFPAKDQTYLLTPDGQPKIITAPLVNSDLNDAQPLDPPLLPTPPRLVYKNNRVPEEICNQIAARGFTVIDDDEYPGSVCHSLLEVLSGRALAAICHARNIRDTFIGPILAATSAGTALDWQAKKLTYPQGGRIPRAIFTRYDLPAELLECLSVS